MNLLKIFDRKPALPDAPAAAPATPHRGAGVVETRSPAPAPVPQVSSRYSALVLVDDEFLQRQLSELFSANDEDWSWECVASVACARQLLDQRDFSLIITQARIQNQPVVDLLNEIHARRPGMLRYFYGAAPAPEDLGRLQGMRPAVIATKNRREMVIAQLERELIVESWLANTQTRQLVAKCRHLPSLPTIYNRVVTELESPTGSFDEVAKLIAQDPLMTAKFLQLVNSAIFALSTPVSKAEDAVFILGAERTKALLLAVPVFTRFDANTCPGLSPVQLWEHSMEVAGYARAIALSHSRDTATADAAFTAGLLHDVGKLLLAANLPEAYADVLRQASEPGQTIRLVEQLLLGTTHAETCACLLGTWGLPLPVIEAIAHHHQPTRSEQAAFSPLTAVHVANAYCHEKHQAQKPMLDLDYLKRLGLLDHRNQWRTACGLEPQSEDASLSEKIRVRQQARNN